MASVLYNVVSPGYFETLDIRLLSGRAFEPADRKGAVPAAIIDKTMAARFWPGEDPIGKLMTFNPPPADPIRALARCLPAGASGPGGAPEASAGVGPLPSLGRLR